MRILRNESGFNERIRELAPLIDTKEIGGVISSAINFDFSQLNSFMERLFDPLTVENLSSVEGLARVWQAESRGLPEKDDVDVHKCVEAFEYCADLVRNDWRGILDDVCGKVGSNLRKFV